MAIELLLNKWNAFMAIKLYLFIWDAFMAIKLYFIFTRLAPCMPMQLNNIFLVPSICTWRRYARDRVVHAG